MSEFIISKPSSCDDYNPKYLHNFYVSIKSTDVNLINSLLSWLRINLNFLSRK